jgi:hypothetical protein
MSKTNFTKVEDSLQIGLEKYNIKKIVESTDPHKDEKEAARAKRLERKKIAFQMIAELRKLAKSDPRIYSKLGSSLAAIKKLLEHPTKLTDEEWENVFKIKNKIAAYKTAFASNIKELPDADYVEKERGKENNKRFNIQDNWLPVD